MVSSLRHCRRQRRKLGATVLVACLLLVVAPVAVVCLTWNFSVDAQDTDTDASVSSNQDPPDVWNLKNQRTDLEGSTADAAHQQEPETQETEVPEHAAATTAEQGTTSPTHVTTPEAVDEGEAEQLDRKLDSQEPSQPSVQPEDSSTDQTKTTSEGICSVSSWLDPLCGNHQPQSDSREFSEEDPKQQQSQEAHSSQQQPTTTTTTSEDDAPPVFMIPSFAGTRLRSWSDVECHSGASLTNRAGRQRPFANFRVGGSVWLDIKRLMAHTSCWVNCIKLLPESQEDDLCATRPDEGLDAITQVDEQLPTGFLWKDAIHMLATMGYRPGTSMFAHPYDWRLPPKKMEQRDRSFSRLKSNIERTVREHKQRNPHSPIRGVFLVAFSMGNLFTQYFFRYLQAGLGQKGMEQWVDEHVYALVMAGAPFLGSGSTLESIIVGETAGLPMQKEQARDMMLTWGSMPWMMPTAPLLRNPRHAAMNHGERDLPVQQVRLTTHDGRVFDPPNRDIVKTNGWLGQIGDPRLSSVQNIIDRWYAEDPLFDPDAAREPFVPPKNLIDHVICAYGINVPTPIRLEFEEDKNNAGFYKKTDEVVNNRGDVRSSRTGKRVLPVRQQYATRKSGDGTVDYASLSWCHSWFGKDVVNITRIPANRKYEPDEVERYENVDVLDPKQLSATEKRPHGFNSFYSKQWVDVHPDSGLQRPKSIQVWEFDGITHRDSVTHPLFLRIWKDILGGTTAFSRAYTNARERVMKRMWKEIDDSGTMDGISKNWLLDLSREGTFQNTNGNVPTNDNDCFWNYAEVRCDRPRYCEYQYRVGDVHLSQSCRLRETPLAKDDPRVLLRDAVAYNVSYTVAPDRVEWQTVYRSQDPQFIPPWAQLFLAFLGGAAALAVLLCGACHLYGEQHLFASLETE
ncbi:Phospholipid--sterol O-acyltransferase [Seminavis robusta]|uniref:Phospholipid--sterol O-acyltransferase n=1 Tax=Seminavis robusta TaxID=568900 RepID=A0A9N8EFE2_9STRA|nr:Phospholipid--sterol O-acyltransferase [Seminavis robusta]|eukprot:Sro857_g211680.1 Phospholipid--sterol O-acyltransferase (907) ;mRNA; r:18251-21187